MNCRTCLLVLICLTFFEKSESQVFNSSWFSDTQKSISVSKTVITNNSILSAGYRQTGTGSYGNVIIGKYDLNGDTIWIKEFVDSSGYVNFAADILEIPNNEIAVIGAHTNFQTGVQYFSYLRLDSIGNILTYKGYFQPADSRIENAIISPDNNLLLVANIDSAGPWQDLICIIKMDLNGNIIWTKLIDYSPGGPADLKVLDDGTIILYQPANTNHLWHLDSLGNILWSNQYDFDFMAIENGLLTDSFKNIYVVAKDTNDIVVYKIDSLGSLQWAHEYGPFNQWSWCRNLLRHENYFYLMIMDSENLSIDSTAKTTVLKIDSAGNLIKSAKFKGDETLIPIFFNVLSQSSFLVAINSTDSSTSLGSYLLTEIDTSLTNSCWLDTSNLYDHILTAVSTNIQYSLLPFSFSDSSRTLTAINQSYNVSNPCLSSNISDIAPESIIVNNPILENACFRSDQSDLVSIKIYSISGLPVYSWSGHSNTVCVKTDHLSNGLYIAEIRTKESIYLKKLVKL